MAHDFRCPERRQTFLLPPDMQDWLPEDYIVHLILDAVALMELSTFEGGAQARRCEAGADGGRYTACGQVASGHNRVYLTEACSYQHR